MIIDMSYWTRVGRRILYVILILIGLIIALKLSVFYMPFLIAFIISLIIEPAIRFIMKSIKLTRKIKFYYNIYTCSNCYSRGISMGDSSTIFRGFKPITKFKFLC